jgi:ribonuclease BN (tRNA processing enzyme)
MQIKVLGCYGGEIPGHATSSFLINGNVALDAGAITSKLPLSEQPKIDAILISHTHLDHILEIGFLADNIFGKRDRPVKLYGIPESISFFKKHVMNNRIWPDFTAIPDRENPVLAYEEIQENKFFQVEGLKVKAVPVDHNIPAVGYIISDDDSSIIYTGDTGPTQKIWKEANKLKDLKAVLIEVSFPNEMKQLAKHTGHLTPQMMQKELDKIKLNDFQAYTFHMKPQFLKKLEQEIKQIPGSIKITRQGDQIKV